MRRCGWSVVVCEDFVIVGERLGAFGYASLVEILAEKLLICCSFGAGSAYLVCEEGEEEEEGFEEAALVLRKTELPQQLHTRQVRSI